MWESVHKSTHNSLNNSPTMYSNIDLEMQKLWNLYHFESASKNTVQVQVSTDKINNNLCLHLFLLFCKADKRKVDFHIIFRLEHMQSSYEKKFYELFIHHVFSEKAACTLGKNWVQWLRFEPSTHTK